MTKAELKAMSKKQAHAMAECLDENYYSMKDETITTQLSNYYGVVKFEIRNGEYVMTLDDWDYLQAIVVSKEFYEAAKKEFSK